jgi:serine/threonine protein kinase
MSKQTQGEEVKQQNSASPNGKKKQELPQSVIQYYSKYRNKQQDLQKKLVMNSVFEIDAKYEIIDAVGQGAYGIVVAARDKTVQKKEKSYIAIKKIEKAFEHKIFTKRTLRELKILRLLKHENVIGIKTILLPKSREEFDDIYLCQELMETDLAGIVKSPQPLSDEHIQFFVYQIFRGLKYMHSAGIIHRDLKPRNLLVNSNCDLKICDFGLSRTVDSTKESGNMTDYVATRWYRPPELLLETKDYGPAVDMWSVGCILAELLRRKPFLPGTETKHQLELIFDVFGTPAEEDIALIPKPRLRKFLRSLPVKKPKALDILLPKANPLAIDLLKKIMVFNPQKRITVEEALKHPYLQDLHYPEDEPTREPVPTAEFEFEKFNLSLQQLKDLLYEEILLYHVEDFKKEYMRRVQANESPFKEVLENENALKPGEKESDDDDE